MNKAAIMPYEYLKQQTLGDLAEIVLDDSQMTMNRHSAWETLNARASEFNGAAWVTEPLKVRFSIIRAMRMSFSPLTGAARA
jgi:hypothetical protein